MPPTPLTRVLDHLRADRARTDADLWAQFLTHRDQAALAALVRRHAAMVWGVCRRHLNHHDAEDAFQATFLVLVKKAAVVPAQAVAAWLYGVARQTAVRLRATAAKQARREKQVATMPESRGPGSGVGGEERGDLREVLDEELSRLPEHYRGVIVLCDLEGRTRKEAARQLGLPEGSVASRLARARALLARRLTRRGGAFVGAAALPAGLASAAAPPALVASTIQAAQATGPVAARVADLTEGVLKAMRGTPLRRLLAVLLVLAALAGAAGLFYPAPAAEQPPPRDKPPAPKQEPQQVEPERELTQEEQLQRLTDQALAAHGGADKLARLQFTMTVKHSNGETQHYWIAPPKSLRWETTHRDRTGKRIVILFPEGRRWWTQEPGAAAMEFDPTGIEPPIKYWHNYVKFFGPRLVLLLKDPGHQVALVDEEFGVNGRAALAVEISGPFFNGRLYFDKETHLLVKKGSVTFSDYKKFDGIPIPQREHDGYYEPEVTEFRVVEKFDPKVFEKP